MSKFAQSQHLQASCIAFAGFLFCEALKRIFQRASVTFLVLVVESGDGLNDGSSSETKARQTIVQ